jgi:quinol monooxygenase YgiN
LEGAVHARSTTIIAQPDRIDDGIALLEDELMALVTHIRGCTGLSLLVDRSTGRYIATSSWDSAEAMLASDNNEQLQPVRQRLLDTLGADSLDVQEWEIAVFHRDHESPAGAYARVTWARQLSGQLEASINAFKTQTLPQLEDEAGFCGASMLVNNEVGLLCSTVSFESKAAVQGNRESGTEQQARMAEGTGIEIVEIAECEVAFHHLRVPEQV